MATRETRPQRGLRRGRLLISRTISGLRDARLTAGLARDQMAHDLGWSATALLRIEAGQRMDVGVIELSEMASVLGMELSLGLHPIGDPVRDKGQLACARRFDALLSDRWRVTNETLLPGAGELRSWDKLLRLVGEGPRHLVGVDIESRVWDIQAIVRRTRLRERDGGVDAILIVLSDSATNRRLVAPLRETLGPSYATSPRAVLRALREGQRLRGSGVLLI